MTDKRFSAALVSVIVASAMGIGLVAPGDASSQQSSVAQETTMQETTTVQVSAQVSNVTFRNQTSNGSAVVVNEAVIAERLRPGGGFVVIHQLNETAAAQNVSGVLGGALSETVRNESLGDRLGNSTLLEPGTHENVTVALDQPLEERQVLAAVLYNDTNANGQFDPDVDTKMEVDEFPGTLVADIGLVNVSAMGEQMMTATETNATTEA